MAEILQGLQISLAHSFQNITHNIADAFRHPKKVVSHWEPTSVAVIFVFHISMTVSYLYNYFITQMNGIEYNPVKLNKPFFVNFATLALLFYIDFYKRCSKKDFVRTQFGQVTSQMLITLIPLYLVFAMFAHFPLWTSFKKDSLDIFGLGGDIIIALFEGGLLFVLYNITMNFRETYDYARCTSQANKDIAKQKEIKEKGFKNATRDGFIFENDYEWDDPTTVTYRTRTEMKVIHPRQRERSKE